MSGEKIGQSAANPNADAWESLGTGERGTFVMGPEGKPIPKEDYDAAMEAYERKMFQKEHPEEQQAKEKWTSRGWAYMTHWYKEHPDEIDDIILPDSKHDKQYYLDQQAKDPRTIGNLVAEYLAREAQDSNPGTENGTDTENNPGSENNPNDEPKTDPNGAEDPGVDNNPTGEDTGNNGENKENDDNGNSGEKTDDTGEQTDDDIESARRKREEIEKRAKEIEEEIARLKETNSEIVKELEKDLKAAKQKLEESKLSLAESYAKNRRLLVGAKNRAEFAERKESYAEALNEYLKIQAKLAYHQGQIQNGETIERSKDDIRKRLDAGEITVEEANEALGGNWDKLSKELQTRISAGFVDSYVKEQKALEASTIDRIDNGSLYRKLVSKIIDNKALKTTLAVAGVAGLAVTGFGLATGALALGVGYTAGGVALGAGKGALSGLLMSRQSSKNSAANNFVDEASIRKGLEGIDAVNNDKDVANVTKWLMQQYESANETDRSSNRKRTAIAMGLGAIIGGAMSGVQVNQRISKETEYQQVVDRTPAEYRAANLENVNHAKGYGTQQFYRELGGDGDSYFSSGAHDAMAEVIKKYGMTVGENDWTYPGPVSEWPTAAREAFTEVANEWAKQGLVPASKIGGRPIYDTFTRTTTKLISSKLHNFFTQTAAVAGAGALGGTISRMQNRAPANSAMPTLNPAAAPEPIPTRPFNGAPEQPTDTTEQSGLPPDMIIVDQPATENPTTEAAPSEQPNQTSGENQTTNAEQPTNEPQPTSEQQPANTPEQQPISDATQIGINNLRSAYIGIGEQGARFMGDTEGYTDEKGDQMAIWWNGLSDDAKNAIVNYETNNSNSTSGGALRQWLALQGYNLNANR